jgi:hypothetical protein
MEQDRKFKGCVVGAAQQLIQPERGLNAFHYPLLSLN